MDKRCLRCRHIEMAAIMAPFLLIMGIAVFYVVEAVLGSAVTQNDCEVGLPVHLQDPAILSRQEFFGYLLPMVLAGLGSRCCAPGPPVLVTALAITQGMAGLAVKRVESLLAFSYNEGHFTRGGDSGCTSLTCP